VVIKFDSARNAQHPQREALDIVAAEKRWRTMAGEPETSVNNPINQRFTYVSTSEAYGGDMTLCENVKRGLKVFCLLSTCLRGGPSISALMRDRRAMALLPLLD
jgi:hypothetical protein